MKIIDTTYIVIYNFCYKLQKDKDYSKSSALVFLAILLVLLLAWISNIVGLVKDNKISSFIIGGSVGSFMIFYVLMGLFLYIIFRKRYKRIYDVDLLQEKFYSKTKQKQRLLNCAVLLAIVLTLALFIFTPQIA